MLHLEGGDEFRRHSTDLFSYRFSRLIQITSTIVSERFLFSYVFKFQLFSYTNINDMYRVIHERCNFNLKKPVAITNALRLRRNVRTILPVH